MMQNFTTFAVSKCVHTFLGLEPWYHYLNLKPYPDCSVKDFHIFPGQGNASDVPLVLLAVVDDLLRVAGLVAVIFVIIGAVSLITSQGNPEATSKAQGTIINALIGLAVAIVAVAFVSFLGAKLGG